MPQIQERLNLPNQLITSLKQNFDSDGDNILNANELRNVFDFSDSNGEKHIARVDFFVFLMVLLSLPAFLVSFFVLLFLFSSSLS